MDRDHGQTFGMMRAPLRAGLALLVVCVLQLSIAAHEVAHAGEAESCEICMQFDAAYPMAVSSMPTAPGFGVEQSLPPGVERLPPRHLNIAHPPRAPPAN